MPWSHCERDLLDDEVCPGCGASKDQWTLEFEVTREFRVRSRKKLVRFSLCAAGGDPIPGEPYEVVLPEGGDPHTGTTNDDGFAKVEANAGGTATVRLPRRAPGSVRRAPREDGGEDEAPAAGAGEPVGHAGGAAEGSVDEAAEFSCEVGQTLRLELAGPGPGELANARWSLAEARVGEEVELRVDAGFADGTEVRFAIVEHDADGEDDPVADLTGAVQGGVATARWTFEWTDDADDEPREGEEVPAPEYVFLASAGEDGRAESPELRFKDWYELELLDARGEPLAGVEVRLTLSTGEERAATTDEQGVARWEDIPAGPVSWAFEAAGGGREEDPDAGEAPAHPDEGEAA